MSAVSPKHLSFAFPITSFLSSSSFSISENKVFSTNGGRKVSTSAVDSGRANADVRPLAQSTYFDSSLHVRWGCCTVTFVQARAVSMVRNAKYENNLKWGGPKFIFWLGKCCLVRVGIFLMFCPHPGQKRTTHDGPIMFCFILCEGMCFVFFFFFVQINVCSLPAP